MIRISKLVSKIAFIAVYGYGCVQCFDIIVWQKGDQACETPNRLSQKVLFRKSEGRKLRETEQPGR